MKNKKQTKWIAIMIPCLATAIIGLSSWFYLITTNNLKMTSTKLQDSDTATNGDTIEVSFNSSDTTIDTSDTSLTIPWSLYFYTSNGSIDQYYQFQWVVSFTPLNTDQILTLSLTSQNNSIYDSTYESYFKPNLEIIDSQNQKWLNIYLSDDTSNRENVPIYLKDNAYTISNLAIDFTNSYDASTGDPNESGTALSATFDVSNTYSDKLDNANNQIDDQNNQLDDKDNQINSLNNQLNTENIIKISLIVAVVVLVIIIASISSYIISLKRKLRN